MGPGEERDPGTLGPRNPRAAAAGSGPLPARGRKGLRERGGRGRPRSFPAPCVGFPGAGREGRRGPEAGRGETGRVPGRAPVPGLAVGVAAAGRRVAALGRRLTLRASASREQALLRARVVTRDTEAWQRDPAFSGLQRVGGVDVSFVKGDSVSACASLVVLSYPELEVTGAPPPARLRVPCAPGHGSAFCRVSLIGRDVSKERKERE